MATLESGFKNIGIHVDGALEIKESASLPRQASALLSTTAMTILHFHLQPQLKYELFNIILIANYACDEFSSRVHFVRS